MVSSVVNKNKRKGEKLSDAERKKQYRATKKAEKQQQHLATSNAQGDTQLFLSGYLTLIRDNGIANETLIHGYLLMLNLGFLGRVDLCVICDVWRVQRLLEVVVPLPALSRRSWKPVWLLLLLVAVAVPANNSGRWIMIAGIKLVFLFTHSLLLS